MAPFESISPKWTCNMGSWGHRLNCSMDEEPLRNEKVLNPAEAHKYYVIEKSNFDNHLASFLEMFSKKMRRTPMINSKPLDLYRLYREVVAMGGCDRVVQQEGCWTRIFRTLENFSVKVTDASYRLKRYYKHYLYAYEQHFFFGKPLSAAQFQNDMAKPSRRKGGTPRGTRGVATAGRWKNARGRGKRGRVPSPMIGRNAAFQTTAGVATTADGKQQAVMAAAAAAAAATTGTQYQLLAQTNAVTQMNTSAVRTNNTAATSGELPVPGVVARLATPYRSAPAAAPPAAAPVPASAASDPNQVRAANDSVRRVPTDHPTVGKHQTPVVSKQYPILGVQGTTAVAAVTSVSQDAALKTAVVAQEKTEQPVVRQIVGIQNGAVSLSQWMDIDKKNTAMVGKQTS